jgi:CheY-like chemotaxis protein
MENNKSINDLIQLIERNKVAQERAAWYGGGSSPTLGENQIVVEEEGEAQDADMKDVNLLIFAADGPFTNSLEPMLGEYDLCYAITDTEVEAFEIIEKNPQIKHVLIDLDRPTDPAKGLNLFSELKMINPNIVISYCTKNPMSMEARNIQTKGGKLLQKPVLRKTLDQFYEENFES